MNEGGFGVPYADCSFFQSGDFADDDLLQQFRQMKIQDLPKFEPRINQRAPRERRSVFPHTHGQRADISGEMDLYGDLFAARRVPTGGAIQAKEEFQNDGVFPEEEDANNEYGENVAENEYPEERVKDIVERYEVYEEGTETAEEEYSTYNEEESADCPEDVDVLYLLEGVENIEE